MKQRTYSIVLEPEDGSSASSPWSGSWRGVDRLVAPAAAIDGSSESQVTRSWQIPAASGCHGSTG